VIFYLDQRVEAFSIKEILMIEIGGNQRARGLMNIVDGVEHPNRAPTTFVDELSKTHEAAHCPDETRRPSDSLDIFVQLLSSIPLIGNNISLNLSSRLIKAHNTGSLSNPTKHRA